MTQKQKQSNPTDALTEAQQTINDTAKVVIGTGVLFTGLGALSGALGGIRV